MDPRAADEVGVEHGRARDAGRAGRCVHERLALRGHDDDVGQPEQQRRPAQARPVDDEDGGHLARRPAGARATVPQPWRSSSRAAGAQPGLGQDADDGHARLDPGPDGAGDDFGRRGLVGRGAARNQATGWSIGSQGGTPSPASTAPGRPRPIGSRATAGL